MQNTTIQDKEQLSVHTNPTRYQHLSDANDSNTYYAPSIPPNMGIEADECLKDICDRMVLVADVTWASATPEVTFAPSSTAMVAYTPLLQISFPDAITNATSTFIRDKLRNWKWLHADIELTIKINATKFQQGALWVRYNPRQETLSAIENQMTNHMRSVTSFPGQLLNLVDSDSITMRFPYCSEFEAFDLTNTTKQGSFGTIQIDVVSPLIGETTSETCNVSVYAKFCNVKVYMPTIEDLPSILGAVTKFVAHSASRSEESVEKSEGGVVSISARAVAAVSDAIGLIPIPGLQIFSRSLGWISRRVEDVALAHGLSKPEGVGNNINITNIPAKGMNHVEGLDNGVNLGILQDNEIEPFQSAVASCDEMSYKYISSRPWMDAHFDWRTTDASDNLLLSHSFSCIGYTTGVATGDARYASTGQFLTLHHKFWHSSVKITLKAVCTFAHSGRLQIMIVPLPAGATTLTAFDKTLAFVWDIRDQSQMSFTVPWVSNLLWEQTVPLFRIDVRVLNELRAPSTVSDVVDIMMFAAFGEDYEVAVPVAVPVSGVNLVALDEFEGFVAHSAATNLESLQTEEEFRIDKKNVGCIAAIGEQLSSVRQLIKRNTQSDVLVNEFAAQVAIPSTQLTINASHMEQCLPNALFVGAFTPTLVGSFARIYRFWGGSQRFKLYVPYQAPERVWNGATTVSLPGNGYYRIAYDSGAGAAKYFHNAQLNPVIEFTVPFYSQTRKKVIGDTTTTFDNNTNITIANINSEATIINAILPMSTYYSAGDDFNFHFLVGPPVLRSA